MASPLFSQGAPLGVYPPLLKPEREYSYLQGSLIGFLIERSRVYGGLSAELITSPDATKNFESLLKSTFTFDKKGKARLELTLLQAKTGEIKAKRVKEIKVQDFWEALDEELKALFKAKPPLEKAVKSESPPKESLLSRLNPFKGLSKLLPKKEDPLRIKLKVPPPPPPTILTGTPPAEATYQASPQVPPPSQVPTPPQAPLAQPTSPQPPPPQALPSQPSPWQWY